MLENSLISLYRRAICALSKTTSKKSSIQEANLQERRTQLLRRIQNWQSIQEVYMPGVSQLRTTALTSEDKDSSKERAEAMVLWLPSQLPKQLWASGCIQGLHATEKALRLGQANDTLITLRSMLLTSTSLFKFKHRNISGQFANTQANNLMSTFNQKIQQYAERYRVAHAALLLLDPKGDWQQELRSLDEKDVHGPGEADPDTYNPGKGKKGYGKGTGEGHRELSWIWRVTGRTAAEGDTLSAGE
jgi:hypothetical protein